LRMPLPRSLVFMICGDARHGRTLQDLFQQKPTQAT
jgi:hypothetical protein